MYAVRWKVPDPPTVEANMRTMRNRRESMTEDRPRVLITFEPPHAFYLVTRKNPNEFYAELIELCRRYAVPESELTNSFGWKSKEKGY